MNSSATSNSVNITECEGRILGSNSTEAYVVTVFLIIMNIVSAPVTSLLNGLVIYAVKTKPGLKTMSNIALACLSTTDCLMGVIGQPTYIAVNIAILQAEASNTYCFIRELSSDVIRLLARASILHLALMYLERYIAIKHPYRYTTVVTAARILCSSFFLWIVALLSTLKSFFTNNMLYKQLTDGTTITLFCTAIIIFCQVVLYYVTRRHEKRIAAHQVSIDDRKNFVKEKKALKLATTVLFVLILTYSPLIVVQILIRISFFRSLNAIHIAFAIASFLIIHNSLMNPVIYCIKRRQFRVAFIEILFRKSNVQAKEIEMRVFGNRERLGWRSQNNEQENTLNTGSSTVEYGINNTGYDKNQNSNLIGNTNTNSKNNSENIIGANEIDNSDNDIVSNDSDHNGISTGDNKSDNNDGKSSNNFGDNDSDHNGISIGDNKSDNSGGRSNNNIGDNDGDHNDITTGDNKNDNNVCTSIDDNDNNVNDSSGTNIDEMRK